MKRRRGGGLFMTVGEVAIECGISASRAHKLIAVGEVPSVRVGGRILVPRRAWEEWLKRTNEEALASLKGEGQPKSGR